MNHFYPSVDRVDGRSLRSGFLRSASRTPDAPCLIIKRKTYTYGEVEATARLWAGQIVSELGRPAQRVGVYGSRSKESYIGVLAALCSGATFVPLNPSFPPERTQEMIRLAELDAIIVDQHGSKHLRSVLESNAKVPLLIFPEVEAIDDANHRAIFADGIRTENSLTELPPLLPGDPAYLLFTSGSTGTPKGVPVTHANALHFIDFAVEHYAITKSDRFSQTFDQTFDLSIFDLFVAWEKGASVYSLQSLDLIAPARFVAEHELTVWFSVPSIPAIMRKKRTLKPSSLPSLRLSLFCGEPLPVETAQEWQLAAPNSLVENLYGPTELTIACLWHRWDADQSLAMSVNGMVPIGRPFAGHGAAIVDDALRPVEEGEAGELCICGPQTTPGYWRDQEKANERFVRLPGQGFPAATFYRTGDRVKRLQTGEYVYLGRTDHQIKVLGFRVELGEIEACLRKEPNTVEAIAMGWPLRNGTAEGIVAFVSGVGINFEYMHQELRASLPSYMVPTDVRLIEQMPLNSNGKIDRIALASLLEN